MKILQVNCLYNEGSTGKIVADIHHAAKDAGIDSLVCYGNGRAWDEEGITKISTLLYGKIQALISRVSGLMYGGCFLSTNKLIRIIKREKPDVVHLHCINGHFVNIYRLIAWLNKNKIKTVLTLHAEFIHTANCGYAYECERWKTGCKGCPRFRAVTSAWFFNRTADSWKKMKRAFSGFENLTVVSVSPWLMNRAKESPILAELDHTVIGNGVEVATFRRSSIEEMAEMRARLAPNGERIIFHPTPDFNDKEDSRKGGIYVLRLAEALRDEGVKVVVAGPHEISGSVPENVVLLGRVRDQNELARLYSLADLTLLTSKRETFSMVTAESLCCGTPVVGFMAGAPEQIAIPDYSEFVAHGDEAALLSAVQRTMANEYEREAISGEAIDIYSKERMFDSYYKTYLK